MATPDLSTLTSSAQIFSSNYTLPQIRAIHRSLHVEIDEKASRLRTQVGNSYRDLLGTADTIVHMRKDNDAVQSVLGRMGGRCGRGVVGSKVSGLSGFEISVREHTSGDVGVVARARLLEACGLVVGRVLKGSGTGSQDLSRGDRVVLASKVLVLSRLLVKSLGEERLAGDVGYAVEAAKKSLGGLKKRLLRYIRSLLERTGDAVKQEDVLKALCAYSLATSSGARDVVTHFLRVRGAAMASAFDVEHKERQRSTEDVLKSLTLYTKTLLDVQALMPFKLSDALSNLKKSPLLADTSLKKLEGLRLDVYERWCGEEIQFFAPFIRHDDLDGPQAREMLFSWAKVGSEVLIDGLRKTTERMMEFKAIIELRTRVLQLWIRDGGKARGFDPSEMLDKLRGAINRHMLNVVETKVNKLHLIGSEVSATLESWQDGVTDQSVELWNVNSFDIDLINGADHFLQELVGRLHGRNDSVSKAANGFQSWRHIIDEVGAVVEQLKRQRWDNDIDEIEDEETIEERQQLLSKDDPRTLHEKLDSTLVKAFKDLDEKLTSLWKSKSDAHNSGKVAMYLLRILRDVRQGLPKLDSVKSFGLEVVPSLHEQLAIAVSAQPLETFASKGLAQKVIVGRLLWEGSPELPTQPSPRVFLFLRDVSTEMSNSGMDLWSAVAVDVIKQHLRRQLAEKWLKALEEHLGEKPNGAVSEDKPATPVKDVPKDEDKDAESLEKEEKDEEGSEAGKEKEASGDKPGIGDETPEESPKEEDTPNPTEKVDDNLAQQRRDLTIQWLFDVSLLRLYLDTPPDSTSNELKSLEDKVYNSTGLDSDEARQRIIKSSQDYHKKTSLLFGLL
ncbi:sphingolipid c9-methyltransferase [Colletotrichum incanum]|uniref:Conserved oligomeric Golgi complex subunit 1 n=1 Tax=Colletotrichum incanum TaxID=1573173 RepID=A0A166Q301_COLIC|nr:sphingolipid c9-methyltransferase [Colletotrichum incanum]